MPYISKSESEIKEILAESQKHQLPSKDEIELSVKLFAKPGHAHELRIFDNPKISGFYRDHDRMAADAYELSIGAGSYKGKFKVETRAVPKAIYQTVNPVATELLATEGMCNSYNLVSGQGLSKDADVEGIWNIAIDCDPVRRTDISSTDSEHWRAVERAMKVRQDLVNKWGFPWGVLAQSGNGGYCVLRTDLPVSGHDLVESFLKRLGEVYGDDLVKIDSTMASLARVMPVFGTKKKKGSNVVGMEGMDDRPHRLSQLLDVPDVLEPVTREALERFVADASPSTKVATASPGLPVEKMTTSRVDAATDEYGFGKVDVEDCKEAPKPFFLDPKFNSATLAEFLIDSGFEVEVTEVTKEGETFDFIRLDRCVRDASKGCNYRAGFNLYPNGNLVYVCFGVHCNEVETRQRTREAIEAAGMMAFERAPGAAIEKKPAVMSEDEAELRGGDKESKSKTKISTILLNMVRDNAELLRSQDGTAYLRISKNGHGETHALESKKIKNWIAGLGVSRFGNHPGGDPIKEAIQLLELYAEDEPKTQLHLRWAHIDDRIYLDLCDEDWTQIEITKHGWKILKDSPVVFRRTSNKAELPMPDPSGTWSDLRPFFTGDGKAFTLFQGTIIAGVSSGPYFNTSFKGEQGSAKSWACRLARRIIDPVGLSEMIPLPNKVDDDLAGLIHDDYAVVFDNVTHVTGEMSDWLCMLSTGGGQRKRALYTDNEVKYYDYKKPVWMNGIPDYIERPDLADRSVVIDLPLLNKKISEKILDARLKTAMPKILGALLNSIRDGLARFDETPEPGQFRMADSVKWINAALGDDSFTRIYERNRDEAAIACLDTSPVISTFTDWFMNSKKNVPSWIGTAEELFTTLEQHVRSFDPGALRTFPRAANKLTEVLNRSKPPLRKIGIDIQPKKSNGRKTIHITRCAPVIFEDDPE